MSPQWGLCSYDGNIDFRVFGGGGGGLLSIFIGSGGVNCGGMSAESFTLGFQKQNRNRIFERLHVVKYSLVRGCWFLPADVLLRGTRGCQSRVGASSEASAGGSLGCQRY